MLYRSETFKGFLIHAKDGELGKCEDFLIDDLLWVTRYLVIQTESIGELKRVLVSPAMVKEIDLKNKLILINSTLDKFIYGPEIGTKGKVTKREETEWLEYHGLPLYWMKNHFRLNTFENILKNAGVLSEEDIENSDESHLRSSNEMVRFRMQTNDGKFGEICGFLWEYPFWAFRYSIIDTGSYLPGRKVIIPTNWIYFVDFEEKKVGVDLSIEDIKESPKFDPLEQIDRQFETKFFEHFERPRYWA